MHRSSGRDLLLEQADKEAAEGSMLVGVIADTHGVLSEKALDALPKAVMNGNTMANSIKSGILSYQNQIAAIIAGS